MPRGTQLVKGRLRFEQAFLQPEPKPWSPVLLRSTAGLRLGAGAREAWRMVGSPSVHSLCQENAGQRSARARWGESWGDPGPRPATR